MRVQAWFKRWLTSHKAANPHQLFQAYEAPGVDVVYAGWIQAFERANIDEPLASEASMEMVAQDKYGIYPEHHLVKLLQIVNQLRNQKAREEACADREQQTQENDLENEKQDRIKARWLEAAEATRRKYQRTIREEFPALCRNLKFIDLLARRRWADEATQRIKTQE